MINHSNIQIYFDQIKNFPLLTGEQERELARRIIHHNDAAAYETLVQSNLRLVVSISRKFVRRGVTQADLIAEGNIGLLKAVERFNPALKVRFSTYATWWIRQAMKRALARVGSTVRVPEHMVSRVYQWKRKERELSTQLGRPPTPEEIARPLRWSSRSVRGIEQTIQVGEGFSGSVTPDHEDTFDVVIADENAIGPAAEVLHQDSLHKIQQSLAELHPREREILSLRFGLEGEAPLTLSEIGNRLGLTRERVRQIEAQLLRHLHAKLTGQRREEPPVRGSAAPKRPAALTRTKFAERFQLSFHANAA